MALIVSVLTGGSSNHTTSSEEVNAYATDFVSQGIVGSFTNTGGVAPATGAFAVNAQGTPDMTVAVSSGVAYVTAVPSSQNSQKLRVRNSASSNVTISANASGSTKYDWVYIKIDATNANTPNTAGDNVATLVTSRSSSASTDDGTPPTYGYCIAVVTVANGASSIANASIRDVRNLATISATSTGLSQDWYSSGYVPSSITANGNRSYTCVINSADLTSFLSPGMRLKFTRTTTAPTQCTSLNGTNQYFSKTSPAAMTFTDDFVVSAWVKLGSYSTAGAIASRYNGTSGWLLQVTAAGVVQLFGFNAGATNWSVVQSYQSVPLNKWVHITAQLDMSTFTATTTTSYIMLDGVDIPASVARNGTNPTALVQAGNLEIGSWNGGLLPFNGKIAQVAIYNAKVTQATIKASMNQTLTGSETSLVSAYSFNNSITDLGSNGNNLSANNSAAATNSDSPFTVQASGTPNGSTDYGIIQSVSFSTNTTIVVQVPEGNTIPTSGGVSAISYATVKAPYGMPVQRGKWVVEYLCKSQITQATPTISVFYNVGSTKLTVPIGEYQLSYHVVVENSSSATPAGTTTALSTSASSISDDNFKIFGYTQPADTSKHLLNTLTRDVSLTSATPYYIIFAATTATTTSMGARGDLGPLFITAEPSYL